MLEVKNIYKKYSSEEHILENISFKLCAGEILGITGKSGIGKTTLLNCIGLIDSFESGQIEYSLDQKEEVITSTTPKQQLQNIRRLHLGYIFQRPYMLSNFDIRHNIFLPQWVRGEKGKKVELKEVLEYLELPLSVLTKNPQDLSVGQLSRISIIRAMLGNPEIIFSDEPTANVDPKLAIKILDLLSRFITNSDNLFPQVSKKNRSMIFICHDNDLLAKYCSRTLIFQQNKGMVECIKAEHEDNTAYRKAISNLREL